MEVLLVIALSIAAIYWVQHRWSSRWLTPTKDFPAEWRVILSEKVAFYHGLSAQDKAHFEFKVQEFLVNHRITGIQVEVDTVDQLLVAASAVIPIFQFPNWRYSNLYEVLLYPHSFNEDFETDGPERRILGMVGNGYMEGKMILSKQALHQGFSNTSDKKNTAIHEFIHLIDKSDGATDGVPALLLESPCVIPWIDLMQKEIDDIYGQKSDINPYGGTNQAEFFAVASEYFFERPKLLAQKHPELYHMLEEIFDQDMDDRNLKQKQVRIGRNSPCPCGSGQKFKRCCGKGHF